MSETAPGPAPARFSTVASAPTPVPRVDVVSGGVSAIDAIAADWRELCAGCANDEPFYRPEWIRAYLRAFAPDARLHVLACRESRRLTGVLPLVRERTTFAGVPVTRLRGASNIHSCHFDLVRAADAAGDRAVAAIWRALAMSASWDVLEFAEVRCDATLCDLIGVATSQGHPLGRWKMMRSPYITVHGSEDDDPCTGHTTRHFRLDLRRKHRRLAEHGGVAVRHVRVADAAALEQFFDLEGSGWKGRAGTAIGCDSATRWFYHAIADWAAAEGCLTLRFLDVHGRPIAAQFGLRYNGRYFTPKLAYDENYSRFGPGHLLIAEALKACARDGVREFDITGPEAEYKSRWTGDVRPIHHYWIFRNTLHGRLLHRVFTVGAALKRACMPNRQASRTRQASSGGNRVARAASLGASRRSAVGAPDT